MITLSLHTDPASWGMWAAALGAGPPSLKHCEVMALPALGAEKPPATRRPGGGYTPYAKSGRKVRKAVSVVV